MLFNEILLSLHGLCGASGDGGGLVTKRVLSSTLNLSIQKKIREYNKKQNIFHLTQFCNG